MLSVIKPKYHYDGRHYTECHYAECHYTMCRYTEYNYTKCRYAECHNPLCHAECHNPLCHAECRNTEYRNGEKKAFISIDTKTVNKTRAQTSPTTNDVPIVDDD
jgi:hypothetical protein